MTKNILPQPQLPPISPANLDQTLRNFQDELIATFNCHRAGVIQSFNAAKQTATVQIVDTWTRNTYQGPSTDIIAPIENCPVILFCGPNGGLKFKIKKGAECVILFNDRDLENWQLAGGIQTPKSPRMHHITDAYCLIGPRSYANSVADYDNTATTLDYIDDSGVQTAKLTLKDSAKLESSLGAKVTLDSQVSIQNETQSLKILIANLIDTLINLQTTDGVINYPITAATAANLATAATNFNLLLK